MQSFQVEEVAAHISYVIVKTLFSYLGLIVGGNMTRLES